MVSYMLLYQKQRMKLLAYASMLGLIIGTAIAGSFVSVFLLITTACFLLSELSVTEECHLLTCVEPHRKLLIIEQDKKDISC